MSNSTNLLFIDPLLLAFRQGLVRQDIQKSALLASARAASDAMTYMTALNNFGVSRGSRLFNFLGEFMASPAYYRNKYPKALGIRMEGEEPETFLISQQTFFLIDPVLTDRQQTLFAENYWWFVNNHKFTYTDKLKGQCVGVYQNEPKDNVSTLSRFEGYLQRLVNNSSQRVRERYEDFPTDIVIALLRRTFL